jgi:hypothetical protein
MKTQLSFIACAIFAATASHAQTPNTATPPAETRPDARYPNPSGQDSNPGTTVVKPTKPAPKTAQPTNSQSRTSADAKKQTSQSSKIGDAAAGCSTPTDAASAKVKPSDQNPAGNSRTRQQGKPTVCTTAGEDNKQTDNSKRVATKPEPSTSTAPEPTSAPRN